jgi:hypothetical protein
MALAGCQPGGTEEPTASRQPSLPANTATLPLPTTLPASLTPSPSLYSTPDSALVQLDRLYQASLNYLADTDAETRKVAHDLGYAPLGGYPSNMCGPLALSILRDAGIVSQAVDLHDFWLLDPGVDGKLLEATFPPAQFEWLQTDLTIDQVDYTRFPLKAGDLVYIYSGFQGDYSHVLAVTRVDAEGRVYSVTNNYTVDGFVVQEYLLYDPAQPGVGMFYEWPDPANQELGLTGFGGLDIWRPLALPYYADGAP